MAVAHRGLSRAIRRSFAVNQSTATKPEIRDWTAILPPYRVLLHNDDQHTMDYVVRALLRAVPTLSTEQATAIMWEAHTTGVGLVIVCPLEEAELYRDRIAGYGLTVTMERDT